MNGKILKILLVNLTVIFLMSCAVSPAPKPKIMSIANVPESSSKGNVYINQVKDERNTKGQGNTYIGTIRGGYGNPIERMHLVVPVSEFVDEHISRAFSSEGFKIVSDKNDSQYNVETTIYRFWARNNAWGSTREIQLEVSLLIRDKSGKEIITKSINETVTDKGNPGMSGNTPVMSGWLASVLQSNLIEIIQEFEKKIL